MTADYRQLIALQRAARDLQRLALDVVGSMTGEEWAAQKLRAAVGNVVGLVDVLGTMVRMPQGVADDAELDSPTYTDDAVKALAARGWVRINDPRNAVMVGDDEDGQHD